MIEEKHLVNTGFMCDVAAAGGDTARGDRRLFLLIYEALFNGFIDTQSTFSRGTAHRAPTKDNLFTLCVGHA